MEILKENITIKCKDCGEEFLFTVEESQFYVDKNFEHLPVRCPKCRQAKKARFEQR